MPFVMEQNVNNYMRHSNSHFGVCQTRKIVENTRAKFGQVDRGVTENKMSTALILAGHGSHISPLTAGLVWEQVDVLRSRGAADEVSAAFWKEMPSYATVLRGIAADDVTIVPLFTASGYFTRTVIPAEMGLNGAVTAHKGRTLRYARALGEHPYVAEVVGIRVKEALVATGFPPEQTGVAVIGHGTSRSSESRTSTFAQAEELGKVGVVREAVGVFLDDTPSIPDAYTLLTTPFIIAVPNFLALGSHTTLDVPDALGLPRGEVRGIIAGREVYYTDPVGLEASLTDAILDLARDAGMPSPDDVASDGFPKVGREAFIKQVEANGEIHLGGLTIKTGVVESAGKCTIQWNHLAELRDYVRTRPTFRPLATGVDLPGGWCYPFKTPAEVFQVIETVYPGLVADLMALKAGVFEARSLGQVVARQTGQYQRLGALSAEVVDETVKRVCSGCIRNASWHSGVTVEGSLPCIEPCNYWMSAAMEQVDDSAG